MIYAIENNLIEEANANRSIVQNWIETAKMIRREIPNQKGCWILHSKYGINANQ